MSTPLDVIKKLVQHKEDIDTTIDALWKEVKCSCCGVAGDARMAPLMHKTEPVCGTCVELWYDGCVDTMKLRQRSLIRQGKAV